MHFPILSVIIFTPITMALLILMLPSERHGLIRGFALTAAVIAAGLSVVAFISYDQTVGGYQFVEQLRWIPALGISYHVGVDGMNLPLVLLTGVVIVTGVLISWGVDDRPREFFAFLFILATGVFGTFASLDLFQLFFFYEIAVFPMYLLIVIWGWKVTREYAAMKLTLYLFIGSVVSLVGALAMYFTSGLGTFNMLELEQAAFTPAFQRLWFPFVFLGFAVLGGLFPFHNWSPDGHVAAPTAVSMFHAGVLMKLGAFAALRVGIMLLPEGAKFWAPYILVLATINVIYGAFIASVQTDFKYVIGFSSVSHMGLVMLGFATLNLNGLTGAGLQMFSHGVMTALFFAVVGIIYDRAHTREIPTLEGFSKVMPLVAVAFIVGGLVSMGMPGFSGFVAEFPIFLGLWQAQPIVALIAALGIVITAAYIMRVVSGVFFGTMSAELAGHIGPIRGQDKVALVVLAGILILIGIYPAVMAPMIESGASAVLRIVEGVMASQAGLGPLILPILPECLLLFLVIVVLAADLFWRAGRRYLGWLTFAGLALTLVAALVYSRPASAPSLVFGGMLRHDWPAFSFQVVFLFSAAVTCLLSIGLSEIGDQGEYYALIVVSTLGMSLMAASADLIMLYLSIETTSIPLYVLAGYLKRDDKSAESGLKYFLFGALTSTVMLYGFSLLYGLSGETNLYRLAEGLRAEAISPWVLGGVAMLTVVGFGFKIAAVPFHFWTPDVYEGAPTPIAAFISTASKAAGFAVLVRVMLVAFPSIEFTWTALLAAMATATMTIGNLLALGQHNIKRLLAYSSVAHAGYAMIGLVALSELGAASLVFYLVAYIVTNLTAFAVVVLFARSAGSEEIADYAGLSRRAPGLALVMMVAMLSLAGMPPLAGFVAKFFVFAAAIQSGWIWLAFVGVLNAIAGLYYYMTVLKVVYLYRSDDEDKPIAVPGPHALALALCVAAIVIVGTISAPWLDWAMAAAKGLF